MSFVSSLNLFFQFPPGTIKQMVATLLMKPEGRKIFINEFEFSSLSKVVSMFFVLNFINIQCFHFMTYSWRLFFSKPKKSIYLLPTHGTHLGDVTSQARVPSCSTGDIHSERPNVCAAGSVPPLTGS